MQSLNSKLKSNLTGKITTFKLLPSLLSFDF